MSRWTVLTIVLAVIMVSSVSIAVQAERAPAAAVSADARSTVTPVLSARRVPDLVAAPVANRRLTAQLDDLLSRTPGTSCLTVAVDGNTVFSSNATTPVAPASVEKLATTEAALTKLSPSSVYTTSVVAAGAPDNGVVDGNLWLVGGGDPLLMTEPYAQHFFDQPITHTSLETLADSVVKAGVHEVRGGVVGDDSKYDRLRTVPQWPARFSTQGDVVGPLSALMVNDGLTQFPPTFRAQTPPATPAADPADEAANQLAQLLSARGVQIDAAPTSGVAPSGATPVAKIDSVPLDQVIGGMLRESDNTAAELLTKDLGLQVANTPSTAAGVQVIRQTLQDEGLPMDGTTQLDGSGLAPDDRATCGLLQSVLDKEGPNSTLAKSLPVAGESGTLTLRFGGTPVAGRLRAKTGTLNQVTALAGYVQAVHDTPLSFAYVINLPPSQTVTAAVQGLEDELGTILYQYPPVPDDSVLGPQAG